MIWVWFFEEILCLASFSTHSPLRPPDVFCEVRVHLLQKLCHTVWWRLVTWRFITVLTRARHWSLSWAGWIQCTSSKLISFKAEVLKLWGAPPTRGGGAPLVLGVGSWLYEGHVYFEWNMDARENICFDRHFAWLKYFNYQLVVPVLAPNYKQHILSPAEVRQLCYSLAELHVKCVYLNLFGWRGARCLWNILTWGASYKRLGTSALRSIDQLGHVARTLWSPFV
jgi:hypothetical protein